MMKRNRSWLAMALGLALGAASGVHAEAQERGPAWRRHTIDGASRGADGVRIADVNQDGWPDLTTGWEEGGTVRVYLHPGPEKVRQNWPAVTVGRVQSPEDAVLVDLDGDGALDVVSSCEGSVQSLFVHWAPAEPSRYLDSEAWTTEAVPVTEKARRWMFCLPMPLGERGGMSLVAGAKNPNAAIGRLELPPDPRNVGDWIWHQLADAGWIMSLISRDMDGDGDLDLVTTDRKGAHAGCHWLENPGSESSRAGQGWTRHTIGGAGEEVMFMTLADLDADGLEDAVTAVRGGDILYFRRLSPSGDRWETVPIAMPGKTGTGKAVAVGDMDHDSRADLVVSCENARGTSGVFWLSARGTVTDRVWQDHEISGLDEGVKFDLVELVDLDGDGDLDVLTCEERHNLGVIWYENPRGKRKTQ